MSAMDSTLNILFLFLVCVWVEEGDGIWDEMIMWGEWDPEIFGNDEIC